MKKPTKNEIKRVKGYIAILEAFCAGKQIQFKNENGKWVDCTKCCIWSFDTDEYRIKPEPQYRPFTAIEAFETFVLQKKRVRFKTSNPYSILSVGADNVTLDYGSGTQPSFKDLFEYYTLEDGSPCGVLVQSE